MIEKVLMLERKKMSICILAGICAVSLFIINNANEKIKENNFNSFVVRIKHYGVDAVEMERSVTIPLEDALYSIPGIKTIQSSSENSVSSVYISFKKEKLREQKGRYEAVRDAAQRVYETLPSSAQRPEILSSSHSRIPVWSAVFLKDGTLDESILTAGILEKIGKPRLESIEGAGEVIVSGAGLKEIYINFDQEKLMNIGLEPAAAASFLAMNDSIFSGGSVLDGKREIIITVDGRYPSLDELLIPIGNEKFIELSAVAKITEREREPDILSRYNGNRAAGIMIMGQNDADLRRLSLKIKKEMDFLQANELKDFNIIILSDLGAEETNAFKSVFNAAMLGAIMTAGICFVLNKRKNLLKAGIFCALSIPLICIISAAILSAGGFSIDRLLLAGIAAGVATAIDAVILCSERLRKCVDYRSAYSSLSSLSVPLIAGGATTVAALIPLSAIEDNGIRVIASAIAVVTVTALIFSLTILPPLLLWDIKSTKKDQLIKTPVCLRQLIKNISHNVCRLLAGIIRFCTHYPVIVIGSSSITIILAVFMLFVKGADTSAYGSEDSVYGQVEFEGGLLAEESDKLLALYSLHILKIPGIKNIETGARTGSGSLLISFDPKQTQAHIVRENVKKINIPGGFVFFHENSKKDRYWEIFIYGDEDQKCRELAQELAFTCSDNSMIRERVLNFKEGSKKLIMIPDREKFAKANLKFINAANVLRFGVFGPVAYKKIKHDEETDVRIMFNENVMRKSRDDVMNTLVSAVNVDTIMTVKEDTEPSSIRRDNRRRSASITISTNLTDAKRVKKELVNTFKKIELPPGYSIEFDPEAIKQSESLSATVLSLIVAIIFCYMIIAAINESFALPLIVLSTIPASLAIPAICLVLSGSAYNSAVACAFIAVSGMTVNAAILCTEGIKSISTLSIYIAIRKKLPALLSTTGTTIAGALPFLFLSEGANTLIRTLSLVGALGVACSCICSITIIPSILFIKKIYFNKKNYSA